MRQPVNSTPRQNATRHMVAFFDAANRQDWEGMERHAALHAHYLQGEHMHGQQPTVTRMVHYVSAGSADGRFPSTCRAATITEVRGDWNADDPNSVQVDLFIMNPKGTFHAENVPYAEPIAGQPLQPYSWHWPERV